MTTANNNSRNNDIKTEKYRAYWFSVYLVARRQSDTVDTL